MKLIDRDHCVFTGAKDLEPLFKFNHFPIFMGCTDQPISEDLFSEMHWHISRTSGSIQLNPLIPLEILYQSPHNEAVGKVWADHHEEFSSFIAKFNPRNILEVGGANGVLLQKYLDKRPSARWTLLEANPRVAPDPRVTIINGFFNDKFEEKGGWDAVVHSHVYEHIYEPMHFTRRVSNLLQQEEYHLFSLPNLQYLLEQGFTNALNFEHTVFITEAFTDALLSHHQFEILEKSYFRNHSIFYAAKKNLDHSSQPFPTNYESYKKIFNEFVRKNQNSVRDLNLKIEAATHPIYLFGGHIFSQFLIGFGLRADSIVSVLDNGPAKIGKRLYGTALKVESPKVLAGKGPCNVILKAAGYNEEIKMDILQNINSQVVFWE